MRLNSELSAFELINPSHMRLELLHSKEARNRILSHIDLIFFVGIPQSEQIVDPLLQLSGRAWACHQGNWFFYCEADPQAARPTISLIANSLIEPHAEKAFKELKLVEKSMEK